MSIYSLQEHVAQQQYDNEIRNLSTAVKRDNVCVSSTYINILPTNTSTTLTLDNQRSSLTTYINSFFDRENRGMRK